MGRYSVRRSGRRTCGRYPFLALSLPYKIADVHRRVPGSCEGRLTHVKACPDINFIGSIEAREIPHGGADVIVCEAFTGNVILKLYEGVGATLIHMVKQGMMATLRSKIGALLVNQL